MAARPKAKPAASSRSRAAPVDRDQARRRAQSSSREDAEARAERELAEKRAKREAATNRKIAALGAAPEDPLAAQAHLLRVLTIIGDAVACDDSVPIMERSKELRSLSAAVAKLVPKSRTWKAEQKVLENERKLKAKAKEKRGAQLEPRPQFVAPIAAPSERERDGEEP
jgi:hypothetical protein